jgi:hypothetical protein
LQNKAEKGVQNVVLSSFFCVYEKKVLPLRG